MTEQLSLTHTSHVSGWTKVKEMWNSTVGTCDLAGYLIVLHFGAHICGSQVWGFRFLCHPSALARCLVLLHTWSSEWLAVLGFPKEVYVLSRILCFWTVISPDLSLQIPTHGFFFIQVYSLCQKWVVFISGVPIFCSHSACQKSLPNWDPQRPPDRDFSQLACSLGPSDWT